MDHILEILYSCAMENRCKRYLTQDEERDYYDSLSHKEKLENQLNKLLEGELLRQFKLFADNCDDAHYIESISAFRKGLAMGLKLNAFSCSEY